MVPVLCVGAWLLFGIALGHPGFSNFHFTVEPSDLIISRENPTLLNCSVEGEASFEWRKEDTTLQLIGDSKRALLSNGSLLLNPIQKSDRSDEGLFQCVATSETGMLVSRSAKLQLASLPRFDEQPSDMILNLGQTAYFPCSIQGVPPATIIWLKEDHPLTLDPSRMTIYNSGALEIAFVEASDRGIYRCNASSIDKFRLSSSASLTIEINKGNKVTAPQFIAIPKESRVLQGSNLTLDCAANGFPQPKIVWLKDGSSIDMSLLGSRFQQIGLASLLIVDIQEKDQSTYMCRAENHEDSIDSTATVKVQVPPWFVKKPENKYAIEKEDIEFECQVYGNPEPSVQWRKNGDLITPSDYFQFTNGNNLRILGVVKGDAGFYQCIGTNWAGNIQTHAQLIVLDSDALTPTSTTTSSTIGASYPRTDQELPGVPQELSAVIVSTRFVTLSWKAASDLDEILAYSVYYREETSTRERVVNTTKQRLEEVSIQGLLPATRYIFRVVAYNQYGPGASSSELSLVTQAEVNVPGAPHNFKAEAISPSIILAQWEPPSSEIEEYILYYMEVGVSEEHQVATRDLIHEIKGLKKFTDYTLWVVAKNENGPGQATEEINVKTHSDVPSDVPQNVTLEAGSSTSVVVRWEPPAKDYQNGIITGYKLRYRLKGSRRAEIVTTDGNRRLYALTNLERGAQYVIKISSMTVNGTGPSTEWLSMETFQNDLDETRVPEQPSALRAKPSASTIYVSWTPPRNLNIMIRGYTIGWGVGFPDVYTKVLDGKQRYYTIENLRPSSEYVISLRAFNQVGDGRPIYETVKTLIETTPEPAFHMMPPVGLKAIVLSATTVVLYWTDTNLSKNQVVTDGRHYVIRYSPYGSNTKYRYHNSTDLNCMIDELKPHTQYEFNVKVMKARRESTWSMSVLNTTYESAPSSPPRDLTVVPFGEDGTALNLHWQPPKQPNGQITSYVILYTDKPHQRDRDWGVIPVQGDKMIATLRKLNPNTVYHFKIHARNSKGYGPLSTEVTFATKQESLGLTDTHSKGFGNLIVYILAAIGSVVVLLIVIITIVVVCKKRSRSTRGYTKAGTKASHSKELKPPDLWIHHDQMELKTLDKTRNMTLTPIPRNSQDLTDSSMIDILERRKAGYPDEIADNPPTIRRQVRAKPLLMPMESPSSMKQVPALSSPTSNGGAPLDPSLRPLYPRTQYNISRAHVTMEAPVSLSELPSPTNNAASTYDQSPHVTYGTTIVATGGRNTLGRDNNGTLEKRIPSAAHNLKSFSVPSPPSGQSAPGTPQSKHITVRSSAAISSPLKPSTMGPKDDGTGSYTEDFTQEMANLEGLMKDLNAITASEFEC